MTDIDRIYAQATREERHSTIIASLEAKPFEAAAFHAGGSRYINKPSCSHCGKPGHDKASCWEIIGHPTDHQGTRSSRGNRGRHGSTLRYAMANTAQLNPISPTDNVGKAEEEFQEKYAQDAMIGNILHEPKLSWILDSGASHHMTSDSSVIENLYHLKIPLQIKDHTLKRLIGTGELKSGMYYLKGMAHKSGTALIASLGSDDSSPFCQSRQQREETSDSTDSAAVGSSVRPYFSNAIITDATPHVEPKERMSTSRVESTQHKSKMNEPRSEVDLEINTMTHGETEAMASDGVIDHELEIAPHGEHGVTNENEEKEDELQEQVVMDAKAKTSKKKCQKLKDYVCHAISVDAPHQIPRFN
ncbi:hypothetical protein GH714_033086 [Hevea brasiliensis]|uniref:CCHC-type domain-containing protein n=1 Tax=Hevea brasiliensis TaxID=3981 RepID=A0A6A6NDT7_HEVBR|nr:hypothetical protein GH714_033086 [Hevea brasiliensis]